MDCEVGQETAQARALLLLGVDVGRAPTAPTPAAASARDRSRRRPTRRRRLHDVVHVLVRDPHARLHAKHEPRITTRMLRSSIACIAFFSSAFSRMLLWFLSNSANSRSILSACVRKVPILADRLDDVVLRQLQVLVRRFGPLLLPEVIQDHGLAVVVDGVVVADRPL